MASLLLIADDLTGALDSAAPFLASGLKVSVALDPQGVAAAMADKPDVLVINSDSRMTDPQAATARMTVLWEQLAPEAPTLLFKKIDSRLNGRPALETIALMTAAGRTTAQICPAVPDMGRIVADGRIMGEGIDDPILLSDHFASGGPYHLADASDDAALDDLADIILADPQRTMAVGARGLAQAIARRMCERRAPPPLPPVMDLPIVIAIGSRDPLSRGQIDHLIQAHPDVEDIVAPGGRFAGHPRGDADIILCRVTDDGMDHAPEQVAARFAADLATILREKRPRTLFASGGATAVAVAQALDVHMARLIGEAAPAIPATIIPEWDDMMFLTKSGGFGAIDTLSAMVSGVRGVALTPCGVMA